MVIAGNAIYALAVKLFLLPADLIMGGTNGIALIMNHFFGTSISAFVLFFNIIMLLAGLFLLGKSFAITTVVSSFAYPVILELFDRIFGDLVLTDDLLLCTVFSGLGIGIALGIVIRAGASTGGMDIPPLVLYKFFRIPVSVGLYVFDFIILISQMYFQSIEKLLYGIILTLIYSIILNKLMITGTQRTELKIVSRHHQEIRDAILTQIDRGVTLLSAEGGYLHEPTEMIFSVISNRELPKVERLVRTIDPECFMVINRVNEVRGFGFSQKKHYIQSHGSKKAE